MSLITFICWVLVLNPPVYLQASNHAEKSGSLRFEPNYGYGITPRTKHAPNTYHQWSYQIVKPKWKRMKYLTDPELNKERKEVPTHPVERVHSFMRQVRGTTPKIKKVPPLTIIWNWPRNWMPNYMKKKILNVKKPETYLEDLNEFGTTEAPESDEYDYGTTDPSIIYSEESDSKRRKKTTTKRRTTTATTTRTTTTATTTRTTTKPTTKPTKPKTTKPKPTKPKPTKPKPPRWRGRWWRIFCLIFGC